MVDVEGGPAEPLRFTTAAVVGQEHARATWALAARERLTEVARHYEQVVGIQELADFVQRRSLIRTPQQPRHWMADVLGRVSAECTRRGEPLLSSLCVDTRGRVGAAYAAAVTQVTGSPPAEPDEHAAHERLACHRHFGAELPADGGAPVRTHQRPAQAPSAGTPPRRAARATAPRAAVSRVAPAKAAEKPVVTCPVHFTVLPANGVCDLCDD